MKMNHPDRPAPAHRNAAFTLIEIMIVIGVIALIAVFAVPALNGVLKGSKMTQSSDEFERDITRARASAMRENHPIEFRFYELRDPEVPGSKKAYRAYQAVKRLRAPDDFAQTEDIIPITEVKMLPPGIIFSESSDYSSLFTVPDIDDNTAKNWGDYDDSLPRVETADYKAFYFRPDGSTNLVAIKPGEKWCVTIMKEPGEGSSRELPPDFVSFQVDPFNGHVRRFEKTL